MSDSARSQLVALLPRLRRFARGLSRSVDQADDLVQAACERALSRLDQWTPGTRLDSWMFRIIQTIWLDQRRAAKVRGGDWVADLETASAHLAEDGERRVEARLTLDEVRRTVARLPDDQRIVLLLVSVEGATYKEAAEILGVPIGTIMSRLARARLAVTKAAADGDKGDDKVVKLK